MNRSRMRRQLYSGGGITNVRRQGYGIGSWVRKLIPNELANVAVKAAPFVAMIPGQQGTAALMRGIGRYDQRGSLSDALKQGVATTAFGAGTRYLGGASPMGGGLRGGFTSPIQPSSPISRMWGGGSGGGGQPSGPWDTGKWGPGPKGVDTFKDPTNLFSQLSEGPQSPLDKILYGSKEGAPIFGKKGLIGAKGAFDMKGAIGKGVPAVFAGSTLASLAIQKAMGDVGGREPGESLTAFNKRRESTVSNYLAYYYKRANKFRIPPEELEQKTAEFVRQNTTEYRTGENQGGRIGQLYGTGPQGLPGIPRQAPDGMEFDMRENGGFQGLGAKEGKDDVPAMLAKNEFVFTADAVRGAGGGDIELGAQKMYDTMKNLEKRMA